MVATGGTTVISTRETTGGLIRDGGRDGRRLDDRGGYRDGATTIDTIGHRGVGGIRCETSSRFDEIVMHAFFSHTTESETLLA